jgi:hypothetical protein
LGVDLEMARRWAPLVMVMMMVLASGTWRRSRS